MHYRARLIDRPFLAGQASNAHDVLEQSDRFVVMRVQVLDDPLFDIRSIHRSPSPSQGCKR